MLNADEKQASVKQIGAALVAAWESGQRQPVEYFMDGLTAFSRLSCHAQHEALIRLIHLEVELARKSGQSPTLEEMQMRFPSVDSETLVELLTLPSLPPRKLEPLTNFGSKRAKQACDDLA
jgi:hypothetical protein